jgi:hypothetical protein
MSGRSTWLPADIQDRFAAAVVSARFAYPRRYNRHGGWHRASIRSRGLDWERYAAFRGRKEVSTFPIPR